MSTEPDCFVCAVCLFDFGPREQDDLRPCPRCGVTQRVNAMYAGSKVEMFSLGKTGRHNRKRETRISKSVSADTGHLVGEFRVIDRVANRYFKRMVDTETGEVIREIDHPLSDHRGRGSAKGRSEPGP